MMLHQTDILFCLWIHINNDVFIKLAISNVCCFHLWTFILGVAVFSCCFTVIYLVCMFNHLNLKVQTVITAPDTFWHINPVQTSIYFLDITCHFYVDLHLHYHRISWYHKSVNYSFCFITLVVPWATLSLLTLKLISGSLAFSLSAPT
jgi:hypothetical protein